MQKMPTGKFVICKTCHSTSLLEKSNSRYNARATFDVNEVEKISLVIPHACVVDFAQILQLDIENKDAIQLVLLSCDEINIFYFEKSHAITELKKVA